MTFSTGSPASTVECAHCGSVIVEDTTYFSTGLTREDFDSVAEFDKATTEVPHIDALPAAMGLTPIGEQGNAHAQRSPSGFLNMFRSANCCNAH